MISKRVYSFIRYSRVRCTKIFSASLQTKTGIDTNFYSPSVRALEVSFDSLVWRIWFVLIQRRDGFLETLYNQDLMFKARMNFKGI